VGDPAALREALERLELEHEELAIAEEELRVQLDAIAQAERVRAAQSVQYREVFDFSPDPLIVTDREAAVQEANLAALQMLSIDVGHLQNKPLVTLVDRAAWPEFFAALESISAERGVDLTVDLKGRRGDGRRVALRGALTRDGTRILWSAREVDAPSAPPPAGDGQVEALGRALFEQAESVRRLQRENAELAARAARAAEAQRAAEALLDARERAMAVLSHELRGPVNIVVGWTKMLRDPRVTDEERARGLAAIERQGMLQASLVGELLDATALSSGLTKLRFELVEAKGLVGETVDAARPLAAEKSIALTCEVEGAPRLLGDALCLTQVLTNLLSNAIKFTPAGGSVSVRCATVETPMGRVAVRVEVQDSGQGIDPEEAEAIFGFLTRGRDGTRHRRSLGLGLYLVRQFVELHGGTVTAENLGAPGGTRFVVTLPSLGGA
jgi:signal transduction histidine kinase